MNRRKRQWQTQWRRNLLWSYLALIHYYLFSCQLIEVKEREREKNETIFPCAQFKFVKYTKHVATSFSPMHAYKQRRAISARYSITVRIDVKIVSLFPCHFLWYFLTWCAPCCGFALYSSTTRFPVGGCSLQLVLEEEIHPNLSTF